MWRIAWRLDTGSTCARVGRRFIRTIQAMPSEDKAVAFARSEVCKFDVLRRCDPLSGEIGQFPRLRG